MDLIQEYFDTKGYDYEPNKKYHSKHKKIVAWQKKLRLKTSISAGRVSSRRLNRSRMRKSRSGSVGSMDNKTAMSEEVEINNMYSKFLSDVVLEIYAKTNKGANPFRSSPREKLRKTVGTIEKFAFFENNIRDIFRRSYEINFPDSMDVLEDVLNLMFDTADNSFKKTIQVITKQITVVPDATAKHLNVKASLWDQIQKLVHKDVEVCRRYNAMPKANSFKYESKKDDFKSKWRSYSKDHAYHQELESFAAVWKNITHLQTTRKFCMWLVNNPHVAPPSFLEDEGLLRDNLSFGNSSATTGSISYETEAPQQLIDMSFRLPKQWANEESIVNSSEEGGSLGSVDISDINIIV